ncbi:MAG TPA: hypothetical protein VGD06_02810 [Acidobacteriota bacterium]
MRLIIRVPKKQIRVAAAVSLVVALGAGAGVAAQTPAQARPGLAPSFSSTLVIPHDDTRAHGNREQHPETALAAPEALPRAAGGATVGVQDPQGGQGQQGQQAEPPQQPQQRLNAPLLTQEEREALALVEQMIREQEGIIMGTAFDYLPGGRRDPFRSLLVQVSGVSVPTVRPFGLPGFLVSEVEVKAIAIAQGRWHAMLVGPNQRAYFVEVGARLFDGHVVDIRPGEVIFEQEVPDVTGARRTREVTKRLRTTESGGGQSSQ